MQDNLSIPYGYCHCGCGEKAPISKRSRRGYKKGEPQRYILGHATRRTPHDYTVEDRGYETPCWIWARYLDPNGYGRCTKGPGRRGAMLAHRAYYERLVGPIPEGLQLDHLCRVHACVNPAHLEPVTNAENSRRGSQTRLTAEDVQAIRESDEPSNKVLAARYGVHPVYIWQIKSGLKWSAE